MSAFTRCWKVSGRHVVDWRSAIGSWQRIQNSRNSRSLSVRSHAIRSQHGWRRRFVDYINTFLKLNAVASNPSWVRNPDDEDIRQFYQSRGIRLDKDSFRYNTAKQGLRLFLNSMWGKLRERSNRSQTKLISEPQELYRFLVTLGIEVHNAC